MSNAGNLPTPPLAASSSSHNAHGNTSSLDALIGEITSTTNMGALNQHLRNFAVKEVREMILASPLASGQDPLTVLDSRVNTLGCLYILSARLTIPTAALPTVHAITTFCRSFEPEQARLAPDRVTMLGKGIMQMYEAANALEAVIEPLYHLLTRYPPSLTYLTTLHALFLRTCVTTRHFTDALPVLSVPITEISLQVSDLTYNDNLIYHYAGGIVLAVLRRWAEAEEFFEIVVTSPAQMPAAIQFEALKKLVMVQLILYGRSRDTQKLANPALLRMFRNSPYSSLVRAYPSQMAQLAAITENEEKERNFETDKNAGLVRIVYEHAPRWRIKKLTETYITLSLSEIGKEVGVQDEQTVRQLVESMIQLGDIRGSISSDGTVTFEDSATTYSTAQIEKALAFAQEQGALLADLDRQAGRSRDFVSKALKQKDDGWNGPPDDELYRMAGENNAWVEESLFS